MTGEMASMGHNQDAVKLQLTCAQESFDMRPIRPDMGINRHGGGYEGLDQRLLGPRLGFSGACLRPHDFRIGKRTDRFPRYNLKDIKAEYVGMEVRAWE